MKRNYRPKPEVYVQQIVKSKGIYYSINISEGRHIGKDYMAATLEDLVFFCKNNCPAEKFDYILNIFVPLQDKFWALYN